MFIVITGRMNSGKDTVASYLASKFPVTQMALADPLKEVASMLYRYPVIWNYTREGKRQKPPLANGLTVGEILQKLGTDALREAMNLPNFWAELLLTRSKEMKVENVVISDARFMDEVDFFMRYSDSVLLCLTRDIPTNDGRDRNHASERAAEEIRETYRHHPNVYIINNSAVDFPVSKLLEEAHLHIKDYLYDRQGN
jgi:hypothetical protein